MLTELGLEKARLPREVISHLDVYLSATQLGITLASLALGWVGEPAFMEAGALFSARPLHLFSRLFAIPLFVMNRASGALLPRRRQRCSIRRPRTERPSSGSS